MSKTIACAIVGSASKAVCMNMIRAIPEQGQLVRVRQRQYVVTEVQQASLPTMLFAPPPLQHWVSLASIEDDAIGEELQVIWELEAGAIVHERVELPQPTGFDVPAKLDAFLDAVRWGAASTADVRTLQAPFRSGIDTSLIRSCGRFRCRV